MKANLADMIYEILKNLLGRELTDAELGILVTAKVTGDRHLLRTILREAALERRGQRMQPSDTLRAAAA
jgi:hypothetical protein